MSNKFNVNKLRISDITVVSSDVTAIISTMLEKQKLKASDAAIANNFGVAVQMTRDGDTAIIGANRALTNKGSGYIFNRSGANLWTESAQLIASDAGQNKLGTKVGISNSGNTVILGAYAETSNTGAAYIFNYNTSSDLWSQKPKLTASDKVAGDQFGDSVSIDSIGNAAVIGAPKKLEVTDMEGSAYIFTRNISSDLWSEKQKLVSSDLIELGQFGFSSVISSAGDRAIVGAPLANETTGLVGAAHIFNFNATSDLWYEKQKVTASDGNGNNYFGSSVTFNKIGNKCVIGAYGELVGGTSNGAAYIFNYNITSGLWYEKQQLTASDGAEFDWFGKSVSMNNEGDRVLVGAEYSSTGGAAYAFHYDGGVWNQIQKIEPSDSTANDLFGGAVSINGIGDKVIVGAIGEDSIAADSGAAYVFNASDVAIVPSSGTVLFDNLINGELYRMENSGDIKIKF